MKRQLAVFPLMILLTLLLSCSSTKEMDDQMEMPPPAGPGIAPGYCRIVATVMKIESDSTPMADDPCSKAPCLATVRVEEVLGMGSGFARTLPKGTEIQVRFSLTLGPTREILPQVTPPLPGLSVGMKFQADIAGGPAFKADGPLYQAALYQVKE
ncbi:MAG TPA: hypothetical protein VJB38_01275 [Bacteroidota bacterium]|nr:hypothetical protein [Bacteroidota bacterium]